MWILDGLEHCSERSELERAIAGPLRFGPEVRIACPIGDGNRRVVELDGFDLVVLRKGEKYFALKNSCPHMHLPLFEKRAPVETGVIKSPTGREIPRDSRLTDDLGLVCRWHHSCFDIQTGDVREWCPRLQADGTSKGWEFMGDLSKTAL